MVRTIFGPWTRPFTEPLAGLFGTTETLRNDCGVPPKTTPTDGFKHHPSHGDLELDVTWEGTEIDHVQLSSSLDDQGSSVSVRLIKLITHIPRVHECAGAWICIDIPSAGRDVPLHAWKKSKQHLQTAASGITRTTINNPSSPSWGWFPSTIHSEKRAKRKGTQNAQQKPTRPSPSAPSGSPRPNFSSRCANSSALPFPASHTWRRIAVACKRKRQRAQRLGVRIWHAYK